MTGSILKGRYCILNQIGQGGEGSLYLAKDMELGISRAVKELPLSKKREAKLLRLLEHPFLPGMIDYTEQGGHCYLVMEYIRGRSLRQCMEEGRCFSPEEIAGIGRKVLQIYSYLHSRRPAVYYGDLKPDNLMLTEEGNLYLVDFGSAVFGYERAYYHCAGTEGYASPEQYRGQICAASDIYTLGKTLAVLCGKRKLSYFFRYPGLGFFIYKCCRSQPEKRWESAGEAEKALAELRPLTLKLKNLLFPVMTLLLLLMMLTVKTIDNTEIKAELPELNTALSPVTAWYYSMPYRSGGAGVKAELSQIIGESLQRMTRKYHETEEQERLVLLLGMNSEIAGDFARAESCYSQLAREENSEGLYTREIYFLQKNRSDEGGAGYEDGREGAEDWR